MKARVKHTGEWKTINPCYDGFYDVETHVIYDPYELEFAPDFDWQAFRREAAKDILCAIVSHTGGNANIERAVELADELIKQLKSDEMA